jgi:hypothetical protein
MEPLYSFESRVREAILLDNIYDDARQKRNIPIQRLSDTQEDLLKGRESWQVTQLKNSLPGEIAYAKEQLLAVAPLADPSRVKMYNKYQEEQLALAALARDRKKQLRPAIVNHLRQKPWSAIRIQPSSPPYREKKPHHLRPW